MLGLAEVVRLDIAAYAQDESDEHPLRAELDELVDTVIESDLHGLGESDRRRELLCQQAPQLVSALERC